jgi:hypothetical protein
VGRVKSIQRKAAFHSLVSSWHRKNYILNYLHF